MDEKERLASAEEMEMEKRDDTVLPVIEPMVEKTMIPEPKSKLHPAFYIALWISLSSAVILFNKRILSNTEFKYPIILTTWHLLFSTIMTQLMARFTSTLNSRKQVPMTGKVYLRAIVPIGVMFSLSLICSNITYVYLTVSFMQMLKATTPVAVLLISWAMRISPPSLKTLGNVTVIVLGVAIASYGEIKFIVIGVIFQLAGIAFEATRLVMVQKLLSSAEFKMDPLVSLYYFAPICALMNGLVACIVEVPHFQFAHLQSIGYTTLLANAMVAFALNVAVVFLIGKTSSLVMTLSGVLKDILLVAISTIFYAEQVTGLQIFGYSVALGGLVYYRLGGDKIREHTAQAQRAWSEYSNRRPAASRTLMIASALVFIVLLLVGLHTAEVLPKQYTKTVQDKVNEFLASKNGN